MKTVEYKSAQITARKYIPKNFTQKEGILKYETVAKEIGRLKQTVIHAELTFLSN